MPTAEAGPGPVDRAGLGPAIAQLSAASRRAGQAAFVVLSMVLAEDARVAHLVQCRYLGADGAVAVTDRRMVVVNGRQWQPDVTSVDLVAGLEVQGWQDERTAALVFSKDGHELGIDRIGDRTLAQQLVGEVRSRVGG